MRNPKITLLLTLMFILTFLGLGRGEKIDYVVSLGKVELGKAQFNYPLNAYVEIDGRQATLMTFETNLINFIDKETIYSDPDSLLPIKIERDLRMWRSNEKITEQYDQHNFILSITKLKGRRRQNFQIKKDGVIHNAILLPFYVRYVAGLNVGWTLIAQLPTRKFEIKLVAIEDVKVPAGIFKSYRFESSPKKFRIWISADERRIPLKILDSSVPAGYTLSMKEYHS